METRWIVDKETGCWEWQGYKNEDGYGRASYGGKLELAHRMTYTMFKGNIPKGMCILHKCDNPGCCNPEHLFVGTRSDNMQDMLAKGRGSKRQVFGEEHSHTSFTELDILEIRKDWHESTISCRDLGEIHGVTPGCISAICRGENWVQLPITTPHPKRHLSRRAMDYKDEILCAFLEGDTISKISRDINMSRQSITRLLEKYNYK